MTTMRVAFILPGLGRVQRGAETAFCQLARHLTRFPDMHAELFGSGGEGLENLQHHAVSCVPRERFERWPSLPCLRNEYQYEELSFILSLAGSGIYRPENFDVTVTCTYPHTNWFVGRKSSDSGPKNLFVTQNGDWPCRENRREYRFFSCDALVCTNPEYFERHRHRYPSALIPNGVDSELFTPPVDVLPFDPDVRRDPVVLMVSALTDSKAVADGVRAVAQIERARLLIAGDGPCREEVAAAAHQLMPGRCCLLGSVDPALMPQIYRKADVFLHMSRDEPFGIVYLEAAASGLPLVVHDCRTTRWILGDHAIFVNTRQPAEVVNGLQTGLNPVVRCLLSAAGRQRITADWSWQQQAAKYRAFMRQIVGTSPAAERN